MTDTSALLPAPDRAIHRALVDALLATGALPSLADLAVSVGLTAPQVAMCLDTLAAADYLGRTRTGRITCLYPFSVTPTLHVVAIDRTRRFAMCSIDALGMAAMLGKPVSIESPCGECGRTVRVEVEPGRISWADPSEAVVVARRSGTEPAREVCCPHTLFACGPRHGEALAERSPDNVVVAMPEALGHAEAIFGAILGETLPIRRPRSDSTRRDVQLGE